MLRNYWGDELSRGITLNRHGVIEFAKRLVEAGRCPDALGVRDRGQMSGGNQQRLVARREALVADRLLDRGAPDTEASTSTRRTRSSRRSSSDATPTVPYCSSPTTSTRSCLMSDRIAVMYEGQIMGVFDRADADRERIGLLMGGHTEAETAT